MKLDVKRKFAGAKEFMRKHKTAILGATTVAGTAALAIFYYKNHKIALVRRAELEAEGKRILDIFGNSETIEGSGPIWDKLKEIFSGVEMEPGDTWMVETNDVGDKLISFIGDSPTMEQIKITKF